MWSSRVRARLVKAMAGKSGGKWPQVAGEPNPTHPDVIPEFKFFAVIKTWMDEDVVEATVRNATAQGAETVFIVDNGSTDATVARAESAGALLAESYETDVFEGRISQILINAVIARQSLSCRAPFVWWLLLDSDEFPEGPDGLTIKEYLQTLDRRFRLVGSSYFNHLPSGKPEYIPGFHPIDFQPLCEPFAPRRHPPCERGHWKHPLQRFDRSGLFVTSGEGFHDATVRTGVPLIEPVGGIVTHHFQYRDESLTRAKLELTCGPGSTRTALHESIGNKGFVARRRSIDAVYEQRWGDVVSLPNLHRPDRVDPRPWPHLDRVRRWYDVEQLAAGRQRWAAGADATGVAD
ncbi:MAG TPA: glycosyltransferase family 2 protein [Acidimicrobiales bacterium]|nr:glycosyltransferase family 2 protein [Acidimicrobiales bacterium]